jgi:hypothetical protein
VSVLNDREALSFVSTAESSRLTGSPVLGASIPSRVSTVPDFNSLKGRVSPFDLGIKLFKTFRFIENTSFLVAFLAAAFLVVFDIFLFYFISAEFYN